MGTRADRSRGLAAGGAAHLLWAVFPLYFELLDQASAVEVVAHRICWTLVFCLIGVTVRRAWGQARAVWADKKLVARLALAGVLVSVNWLIYVWAILHDQVVDAALGYFINPLVTVGLGLVVLRERLRRLQYVALGVGLLAVVVIVIGYGHFPWVGLGLALSFAAYALMKNRVAAKVAPLVGLGLETFTLAPLALAGIVWLQLDGRGVFLGHGLGYTVGLALTGVVTAVPLLLFAQAAGRIPLATLGLLQYITPTGQFLIGLIWFHEAMPAARWAGFGLIWVALILLSLQGLRSWRAHRRDPAADAGDGPLG